MISPDEARAQILSEVRSGRVKELPLAEAGDYYLAADVESPHDHPFFDQSAMDGYAMRFADIKTHERLRVIGELPAGTTEFPELGPGNAVRIFTGAAVPPTADTVVIQEHVSRNGQWMHLEEQPKERGQNIRRRGEQIEKGQIALNAGTLLDPAAIGFLATLGVQSVPVVDRVTAGIITTGNEFADPRKTPAPGQIFESNGAMLRALLHRAQTESAHKQCADDLASIAAAIETLANAHDVLFITGGVSVGDYDYTPEALEKAGFRTVFHKVNQKPGKPLLFAVRKDCVAFGMPGNPRSVLSCFFQYALPALRSMRGAAVPQLINFQLPLSESIRNPSRKALFLFAEFDEIGVRPRRIEGSHMLASAVNAPAMIEVTAEQLELFPGDTVKVHLLPQ